MEALSLPRRDRAYVVGDKGIIYRYRVVPVAESVPNALPAPAMPGYDLPVRSEADKVRPRLQALKAKIQAAMKKGAAGLDVERPQMLGENRPLLVASWLSPPPLGSLQETSGFQQDVGETAAEGPWVQACCAADMQGLESSVNSFVETVTSASGKYRNLNLIIAGFRLFKDILDKVRGVSSSFQAVKSAPTLQAASEAVDQLSGQVDGVVESTASAWQ